MSSRASKAAASCVAALVVLTAPVARARLISPASGPATATASAEDSFEELSRKANGAALEGDWGAALEAAREALDLLPQDPKSHGRRADLIALVGDYKLDERNDAQLRVSVQIVRRYLEGLEAAADGSDTRAQEEARAYVAELERRVPTAARAIEPAWDDEPPPRASDADPGNDGPAPARGRALQVGGGATMGIGAVLVVAGLVFAPKWRREADRYEELEDLEATVPGSVSSEMEAAQHGRRRRPRATTLGLTLPGIALLGVGIALVVVGTRRTRADRNVAVGPGGLRLRF